MGGKCENCFLLTEHFGTFGIEKYSKLTLNELWASCVICVAVQVYLYNYVLFKLIVEHLNSKCLFLANNRKNKMS